jgi:uncharacterized membrane protein YeaQ/YmgE (transglycosylase-associated protein family)
MLGYSVGVWFLIGALCGWLESRRTEAGQGRLILNIVICIAGAIAAGIVFKSVGELGPPWQGPIYSGFIGGAIAIVLASPILQRFAKSSLGSSGGQ